MFTEQGSSAPQMTAAKVMDIISRLPGCSRQAADAVSAHTHVKKENASTSFKISKSECPDIWTRPPKTKMAKIMVQNRRPSRSSRQESVRSSFGKTIMEKQFLKVPLKHGWEDVYNGNVHRSTEQEDYSYPCMWTISNWHSRQNTKKPTWKILMEDVDLGAPTSFLDHENWVVIKENVQQAVRL